jgi:uncharacterized membrane protein
MSGVAGLKPQDMFTLGIYIAVHGAVKVAIVVALAVGAVRVYPWAIGALGILTIVQIVDLVVNPAIGVILLTVLDLIVIALTWREWRERRSLWDTFAATAAWVRRHPAPAGA